MSVPPKMIDPSAPKIVSWCLLTVTDSLAPPTSPCDPCLTFFTQVKSFEGPGPSSPFSSGSNEWRLNLGGQPLSSPGVCIPMITARGLGPPRGSGLPITVVPNLAFTSFTGGLGAVQPVSIKHQVFDPTTGTSVPQEIFSFDITMALDANGNTAPTIDPKLVPLLPVLTMPFPGDTIFDVFAGGQVQLADLKEGVTYSSNKLGMTFQLVPGASDWANAPWVDPVTGHPPPPWMLQAWVYDGPIDVSQNTAFTCDLVGADVTLGPVVFGLDPFFYAAGPLLATIATYVQIWAGQ
jgi:hypothetical protein